MQIFLLFLLAAVAESWPLAAQVPAQPVQQIDGNPLTSSKNQDRQAETNIAMGRQPAENQTPGLSPNLTSLLADRLGKQPSMASTTSSQAYLRRRELQQTLQRNEANFPIATSSNYLIRNEHNNNLPRANTVPNQSDSTSHLRETDSLIEGSGSGPLLSGGKSQRVKLDDTEDSEDDDDDYDDRDFLDIGSGHKEPHSAQRKPMDLIMSSHSDLNKKPMQNDFYNPFRPAQSITSKQPPLGQSQNETTRFVPSERPSTDAVVTQATFSNSPTISTPLPEISTTTRKNPSEEANETKGEIDYDYEDETDADYSEATSAFEDNDPTETDFLNKPDYQNSTSINTQTINTQHQYHHNQLGSSKFEAIKPPTTIVSAASMPTIRNPSVATQETHLQAAGPRHTTSRPVIKPQQTTPKPIQAVTTSVAQSPANDYEEEEEDEEDEEEEEIEEDELEEDEESPQRGVLPITGSSFDNFNSNQSIPPARQPQRPTHFQNHNEFTTTTRSPAMILPSHIKHRPPVDYPTATFSNIPSAVTTNVPKRIISVPFTTTTAVPTTTTSINKMLQSSIINSNAHSTDISMHNEITTSTTQPPMLVEPTQVPTLSPNYTPLAPVMATERPTKYLTTIPNTGNRPFTSLMPNIPYDDRAQRDNDDTLTKQIYDKAVEVYHEADKTVRAAWHAVWPPNINLDSSSIEPLLAQPLFFMRKCSTNEFVPIKFRYATLTFNRTNSVSMTLNAKHHNS